jgi:hypothetical protein
MLSPRALLPAASSLLLLLTAGCTGVVEGGGSAAWAPPADDGGAPPTPWTPPAGDPLYGAGDSTTGYGITLSRIDSSTGQKTEILDFGDILGWEQDLVLDEAGTHVFTLGSMEQGMLVFTADLVAGTSTPVPLAPVPQSYFGYSLAGVTADGTLVAVSVTDTTDGVYLIDPNVGSVTLLGDIAPISTVNEGTATYDHVAHVVYFMDGWSPGILYSYSLDTMTAARVSVTSLPSDVVVLAGVAPGGNVVGAFWDLETSVARVMEIDPVTGVATPAGQLGDLAGWHTYASLNGGVVRSYGAAGPGGQELQQQLYALDLATQAWAKVPVSDALVIARY